MVGMGVLAYMLIAGGSLVFCAARNLKGTETSGKQMP
jgi:hypothetical protein